MFIRFRFKYELYRSFIPSIHDAGKIFNQEIAIKFIGTFTKGKSVTHVMDILTNYLLPQIGELNFRDKACYIGHMVFELLKVFKKKINQLIVIRLDIKELKFLEYY